MDNLMAETMATRLIRQLTASQERCRQQEQIIAQQNEIIERLRAELQMERAQRSERAA